jgi:hypothetical protein
MRMLKLRVLLDLLLLQVEVGVLLEAEVGVQVEALHLAWLRLKNLHHNVPLLANLPMRMWKE